MIVRLHTQMDVGFEPSCLDCAAPITRADSADHGPAGPGPAPGTDCPRSHAALTPDGGKRSSTKSKPPTRIATGASTTRL